MPTGIIAATVHLYLGVDVVQQCWDDLSSAVGELGEIEAARNPEIERLARAVAYEARAPGPASRVLLDSIALAAAVALRRYRNEQAHAADRSTAGMPLWRLKRVQNLIMSALDKDLSLAELAAASGYSISRFCHAFKNSTGISPHRYVMLQRVERASELLLQGKRNLAEVAAIVGFSDLSHMTHVMRRYADTTPKRLRKSVEITRLMLALQAVDVERGRCLSAASSNLPKIDRNDKPT